MTNPLIFGERRQYKRKKCFFKIELDDYHGTHSANLRDLSKSGAFVETSVDIRPFIGQELVLTIPFRRRTDQVVVKGKITRIKEDGFGVTFVKK